MDNAEKEYKIVKLKLDVIFKRMFGDLKNEELIKVFIANMLELPPESITKIVIDNVELTPEFFDQKFSRLDLKMEVDGSIVNIEMQISAESDFRERTLFHWARLYSNDLKSGEAYRNLKKTICINIVNFNLFDTNEYHSNFGVIEKSRGEVLSDKFAIHFFELKKLNKSRKHKPMEDWLDLINAETEEDLMAHGEATQIPEIKKAIVELRRMSASEKIRQEAEYREKMLHDEASALSGARMEGIAEGKAEERQSIALKMRNMGYNEDQIKVLFGE